VEAVALGDRGRPFPPAKTRRRWPAPPRVWLRTEPTALTYRRANQNQVLCAWF